MLGKFKLILPRAYSCRPRPLDLSPPSRSATAGHGGTRHVPRRRGHGSSRSLRLRRRCGKVHVVCVSVRLYGRRRQTAHGLAVKVRRGCRDSPEPPVECGGAQDRTPRGRGDAGGRPRSLPASSRATGARWPVLDFNQQPFLSGTTNSHSTHCHAGYEPTAVRERPMPVRNSSTDHRHRRRHRRRCRRRHHRHRHHHHLHHRHHHHYHHHDTTHHYSPRPPWVRTAVDHCKPHLRRARGQ